MLFKVVVVTQTRREGGGLAIGLPDQPYPKPLRHSQRIRSNHKACHFDALWQTRQGVDFPAFMLLTASSMRSTRLTRGTTFCPPTTSTTSRLLTLMGM